MEIVKVNLYPIGWSIFARHVSRSDVRKFKNLILKLGLKRNLKSEAKSKILLPKELRDTSHDRYYEEERFFSARGKNVSYGYLIYYKLLSIVWKDKTDKINGHELVSLWLSN